MSARFSADALHFSTPNSPTGNIVGSHFLTWNIYHPWLGIIYITSPGFFPRPHLTEAYPYFFNILPQPVTSAEPTSQLPEVPWTPSLYQGGYVTWITHL